MGLPPSFGDFRASGERTPESLRSPTLKPPQKTPGNLRFTALTRKEKCEVGRQTGAGEGIRTLDPDLGKVVLYH
jgi:hypothetical protein